MRSRPLWSATFALAAGLGLGAQAPAPGSTPRATPQTIPAPVVDPTAPVTVTGCLKAWVDDSGTPAAIESAGGATASRFTLTRLETKPPQIAAAAADRATADEVRLILESVGGVDLSKHVNTRVKITGTVVQDNAVLHDSSTAASRADHTAGPNATTPVGTSGERAPSSTDRATAPESSAADDAHAYETMKVAAVETIANECGLP